MAAHACSRTQIQHYHVTVTLLLALADALGIAAAAASGRQLASDEEDRRVLAAGAATLSSAILQRRLKALYFALSSDVRGKANAALALLAATAGACAGGAAGGSGAAGAGATVAAPSLRDLVRAFDWSLSALPGLAQPPRCDDSGLLGWCEQPPFRVLPSSCCCP